MRTSLALLVVAMLIQAAQGDEENPLKGLEGVQFSSSVDTMPEVTVTKDRLAQAAERALKKAGIWRKTEEASPYPQLRLAVHGGKKQGVVFFVWELQVKEKVKIPADKSYRHTAFQGSVIVWQSSGMMTTDPAKMELDLMAQMEKTIDAFIKQWRAVNPADSPTEENPGKKK
jgi:hypothetical protein